MSTFSDALQKAGIAPGTNGYDKRKAISFTLEMKLLEMKNHVSALERMYNKYLVTQGQDQFDVMDGLANRFGYMVIAFQDVMTTVGRLTGRARTIKATWNWFWRMYKITGKNMK